ncbi:MAG: discoidin domain-containing protein, partial [Acidimicrobiia bacterium]|nr:discoidin domain-containing protein [Acidimicrobiia bacterium]
MRALLLAIILGGALQAAETNLAPSGVATQSTDRSSSYLANRAIDGDKFWSSRTDNTTSNNWWELDLGAVYSLNALEIVGATEWGLEVMENLT